MNRFAVILLLSALFFLGAAAQPVEDTVSGHCYQLFTTPLNFSSALTNAASQVSQSGFPGYLATITSVEENDFIVTLINSSASPFIDYYTAGQADANGVFVWGAGPEDNQNIANSTQCLQAICFFSGAVTYASGQAITYINGSWSSVSESLVEAFIVEFDNCVPSTTPTATPNSIPSASISAPTTTGVTTTGASITPSNFRPTITLGTLATTSSTGKKATTGRRATSATTTGKRSTTGVVSAASSMTFSAVSVAIAAVSMMFLRR